MSWSLAFSRAGGSWGEPVRIAGARLAQDNFDSCVQSPNEGHLTVDLRSLRFIEPYALVSLAAIVNAAVEADVPVTFLPPTSMSHANYLARMHLPGVLDELGIAHGLPTVRESSLPDTLLELQTFEDFNAVGKLGALVVRRLSQRFRTLGSEDSIFEVLVELANNAVEHAGAERAFVAAQVYDAGTPQQRVALAIGDAGCGVTQSLRDSGYTVSSDAEGLKLAMTPEVTSSHEPGRGHGLPDACDLTVASGGSVVVRSGEARSLLAGNSEALLNGLQLPGTVVGATIHCGVASSSHPGKDEPQW